MEIETTKAVNEPKAEEPRDGAPESTKSVVVFVGSAHPKGATWTAATRFLDHLQSMGGVRGEIVLLGKHRIGLCLGCKACFTRGEENCPLKDDRDALIAKMDAADGVVFAAPNYSFQVSATMKAFLDRLGFVFHRPRFHGKAFTSVVPQGFHGGGKVVKYLDFVGFGLGFNVVKGAHFTALYPIVGEEELKMNKTLAALGQKVPRAAPQTRLSHSVAHAAFHVPRGTDERKAFGRPRKSGPRLLPRSGLVRFGLLLSDEARAGQESRRIAHRLVCRPRRQETDRQDGVSDRILSLLRNTRHNVVVTWIDRPDRAAS